MSTLEILLLRHGQSEGNASGHFGGQGPTPLTILGQRQAAATAAALAQERLTAIWTSDLVRARQTAAPVAAATGLAPEATPALRERSLGLLTGLSFAEAERRDPALFSALMRCEPTACAPDGETLAACAQRASNFVDQLQTEVKEGRVLLVSHAFTLNLILRHLLGLEAAAATFFRTDNCGLHRLRHTPQGFWNVESTNDRRHLVGVV